MPNSIGTPSVKDREWAKAAGNAQDVAVSMGEMACHVASAVGEVANQAACDVGKKANDLTANAGVGIQDLGDKLSRNTPHDGLIGSASQAVATSVKQCGEYLEEHKLSGVAEEVAHLVRRNPIAAIFVAASLGWYFGRLLKR